MKHVLPGLRPMSKWLVKSSQIVLWLLFTLSFSHQVQAQGVPDFYGRPTPSDRPEEEMRNKQKGKLVFDSLGNVIDTLPAGPFRGMAIGISGGTNAFIGGDIAAKIGKHFNLRLGYNYLEYTFQETQVDLGGQDLLFKGNLDQSNIELLGEFSFAKDRIRLVAGAAYSLDNQLSGEGILADTLDFEDIRISPDEVGFIRGDISFANMVSPYLGIGFGRAVPQRTIGLSLDLGAYYKGSPDVTLVATELLRNNVNNEQTIEDAVSFIQWWPVVSLRLAVKLF